MLLGNGASFTASLQKIPEGPKRVEVTTDLDGLLITSSQPAPPRPKYVVYKVARVAFQKDGEPLPEYRRAMQSVLTEYHALIHPSLFHHANIIDFLGFAWGSNPFSPSHKLPAVVVEYAEHGTLADLLNKNFMLDFDTKHGLCLDVARGLSVIHEAGLIHGDVKAENVLICSGVDRKYTAKIADFGFSIMEATENAEVWLGGTNPWRAPETRNAIQVQNLKNTDTYSLGLLIWLVCVDGKWPFDYLLPGTLQGAARSTAIEDLKQSDELLARAIAKAWLLFWLHKKLGSHIDQLLKAAATKVAAMQMQSQIDVEREVEKLRRPFYEKLYTQICQVKLFKSLGDIFEHSLQADPTERDLDVVVTLLESDAGNASRLVVTKNLNALKIGLADDLFCYGSFMQALEISAEVHASPYVIMRILPADCC